MSLIKAENLTKIYGTGDAAVTALDHVGLAVEAGEFVAVMGPSGCGKSTLLQLLGGLDRPTEGTVAIDGVDITAMSDTALSELRRRRIGFVFQFYNLIPVLDAAENAALPLLLDGLRAAEANGRGAEWLAKVGLADRGRHRPSELSGGQQQRVAIARALIADPALILADEPTGNLDTRSSDEVAALLRKVTDEWGRAVVMVTHDPRIAAYADRIVFLKDGKIVDEAKLSGRAGADAKAVQDRAEALSRREGKLAMGIQLTLAARYLAGRRLRAVLTTLAVVFGVLIIFGMNILVPTMLQAVQSTMIAASDQVDMTVTLRSGEGFPSSIVAEVRAVQGIRAAQGLLGRPLNLPADFLDHDPRAPDRVSVLSLIGLDPVAAREIRSYTVREGRFLEEGDTGAAVIASSLADTIGLQVGDSLTLPTTRGLTRLTVVGIRTPRAMPGNEEVLVTLPEAQELLDAPGLVTSVEADLSRQDDALRSSVEHAVESRLGQSYTLGTLSVTDNLYASLKAAQIGLSAFAVLALFMGAFIIFNTFRTIVAERRRDIGMLRALGASRRTVVGVFLAEGILQGVVGTVLGMLLGYLLAAVSTAALEPVVGRFVHLRLGLPRVTPGIALLSVVLGVGVTLAAGLFPAFTAGRVTPMEALRPASSTAGYRRKIGAGAIAGLAFAAAALLALASGNVSLLALGAVLFMVGLVLVAPALVRPLSLVFGSVMAALFARQGTGTLAQGNLTRQPSRAAVTASTTMIALALTVALGGMTVSITQGFLGILRKSLGSDYLFVPPAIGVWQNNVGATNKLADRLRSTEGVGQVSTLRYAAVVADVKPAAAKGAEGPTVSLISLLGIDPETFPQVSALSFTDGDSERAYAELADGRTMIANPILAASAGLKVGDLVPLETPAGPQPYRVVGVASDFMDAKISTAFVSQASLAMDFNKTEDVFIQLNLAAGAEAHAAGAAVRKIAADYPQFSVVEGKAYYNEMSDLFKAVFSALYLLFAFMALPSLITMINTLAIGVIERTREIGMLRAVGTTRPQVRRMVLTEALLLAAFGTAFGLVAGLYLGYLLVRAMAAAGFPVSYLFPWAGLVAAVVIGLLFGALAAIVPARKAAGLEIVEALRYE